MQALLTWIQGWKSPSYSNNQITKPGVIVDKRAKVVLLPITRDITQTKEFWDKAVMS
ncbi:MAG: hypothetical protein K0R55_2910 [Sporomusa sp.]|jgi:hypothetical protein|nr:hypothetical protein [Sporomusa sp.]